MQMNQPRKFMFEHPSHRLLLKAANELNKAKIVNGIPETAIYLINNAEALVRGSIDVLMERDPMKHELGLIILMLLESVTRRMEKVDSEMVEVYEIKDEFLFSWALQKAYALPSMFTRGER